MIPKLLKAIEVAPLYGVRRITFIQIYIRNQIFPGFHILISETVFSFTV